MRPTLVTPNYRPTMPAVTAALARVRSAQDRVAEVCQASDPWAVLALTLTEVMPQIVGVLTADQGDRLRSALAAVRAN